MMEKQKLSFQIYKPDQEAKAVVFCVHGMQEHKMRYDGLARYFTENGYACITYDLPGHGQTAGVEENKGWFSEEDGWKTLVDSAVEIATIARNEFHEIPVIYFGHSMGTIIGRVFLQNYDNLIDGMILSGVPTYQSACKLGILLAKVVIKNKGKKGYSRLLETMSTGSFNKAVENPETDVDWLSYNKDNVQAYIDDEWCGFPFTNQGYLDLFTLMEKMGDVSLYRCNHSDLPIFVFAGEDDPCIGGQKGFEKSISILKEAGYQNIETKLFAHMRHETLHEDDAEKVMETAVDWLNRNIRVKINEILLLKSLHSI